jgi:hypothetical protein
MAPAGAVLLAPPVVPRTPDDRGATVARGLNTVYDPSTHSYYHVPHHSFTVRSLSIHCHFIIHYYLTSGEVPEPSIHLMSLPHVNVNLRDAQSVEVQELLPHVNVNLIDAQRVEVQELLPHVHVGCKSRHPMYLMYMLSARAATSCT